MRPAVPNRTHTGPLLTAEYANTAKLKNLRHWWPSFPSPHTRTQEAAVSAADVCKLDHFALALQIGGGLGARRHTVRRVVRRPVHGVRAYGAVYRARGESLEVRYGAEHEQMSVPSLAMHRNHARSRSPAGELIRLPLANSQARS